MRFLNFNSVSQENLEQVNRSTDRSWQCKARPGSAELRASCVCLVARELHIIIESFNRLV